MAATIQYRTDDGPLSATVTEQTARTRVQNMFNVWQNVGSASISYSRAGAILDVGAFTDGDVSTAVEYDAVNGDCGSGAQNPIIYDVTGEIFEDVVVDDSVIGFAGPCSLDPALGRILSGNAVMNGLFQDGQATPIADSDGRRVRRDLHPRVRPLLGSRPFADQRRLRLRNLRSGQPRRTADDVPLPRERRAGLTLSIDDVAWISKLYPVRCGSFATTHGTITGTIFFSDGESHAQLVNVVARRVDNPAGGADESRTTAALRRLLATGSVSISGNPINEPSDQPRAVRQRWFVADIGFFEIPLPPGNYTIEVESIDPEFVEGSSVGGDERIDMPGTAPPPSGPITVTAGQATSRTTTSRSSARPRASTCSRVRETAGLTRCFAQSAAALAFAVIAACGGRRR